MSSNLGIPPICGQCLRVIYGATDSNVVKFCSNVCTKQFERLLRDKTNMNRMTEKADLNASETPNNTPEALKAKEVYKRVDETKEKPSFAKKLF